MIHGSGDTTKGCTVSVTFHIISSTSRYSEVVEIQLPSARTLCITAPECSNLEQSSPEYNVIKQCYAILITALKPVVSRFSDVLFSKDLIPSTVLDSTRERVYTEQEKAQKIVDALRDSIKMDASKYYTFIKVFEEDAEPWTTDICKRLRNCFRVEKGKFIRGVFDTHKSELISEISPRSDRVNLLLYRLSVFEATTQGESAQRILSLLNEKLKHEPKLFPRVCAALNKAGINRQLVEAIKGLC